MHTKPFNEHLLWKGAIQRAQYAKYPAKQPMVLPLINSLTGTLIKDQGSISDEINAMIDAQSRSYWNKVNMRKQMYRLEREARYKN